METFSPFFILTGLAVVSFSSCLAISLVYFLRNSLTELTITRQGMTARTNNNPVQFEIVGNIERIDSEAKRQIRLDTEELELIDTEKYGATIEVLTANLVANQPLIHAAYENHHTRELSDGGADKFIDNKANNVRKVLKPWLKDVSVINDKIINAYVWHWASQVVMPNVKKACNEKLGYYKSLLNRYDICESIKEHVRHWIEKNEKYLDCLDELGERTDILRKSAIFNKE